jgi:lipoate-protein ligase A
MPWPSCKPQVGVLSSFCDADHALRCRLAMRWPGPCHPRSMSNAFAATDSAPVDLNVIRVQNMPVLQMLRLEESLFRHDVNNWCVINSGTSPCVIAGRSSVIADTVHVENARAAGVPIIRRFTGGGVVCVYLPPLCHLCSADIFRLRHFCSYADFNTLFVSFISRAKNGLARSAPPYPNAIMLWSAAWYGSHCFRKLNWDLQSGQDYSVDNRKVGGNAQAFGAGRWVHHTSFLHDFDRQEMAAMLSLPKKQPDWRKLRDHR